MNARVLLGVATLGVATLGAAASLLACSAVLGFDTLTLDPDTVSGEGGPGSTTDGNVTIDGNGGTDGGDAGESCATANKDTSKQHCGRCDHGCGGATCTGGKCDAIQLASGLANPEGLAVDETDVYVAEYAADRIRKLDRTPPGSCSAGKVCMFATSLQPGGLGIDSVNVYWTSEDHEIFSCERAGCSTPKSLYSFGTSVFAPLQNDDVFPLELIVKNDKVYFPENTSGAIQSVPVTGLEGVQVPTTYLPGDGTYAPVAIAVDDTTIYFSVNGNTNHSTDVGAVPLAGGPVRALGGAGGRNYGIGLSPSGTVYFTVPFTAGGTSDGKVQSAPKIASGAPLAGDFASDQTNPGALVVDATNVYWLSVGASDQATGAVLWCPQKGCPSAGPNVLATGQRRPRHLVQDDTALYWSNEGLIIKGNSSSDGEVWKIAKP